jgi:hypothetical protein
MSRRDITKCSRWGRYQYRATGLSPGNEYWDRAWITQKLVLAKDIWIVAADRALHYPRLLRLARRSGRPRLKYRALNDFEHAIRFQTKLIYNLLRFQEKRCSALRDRIYSMLSISSDSARIEVDYRTSAAEVAYHLCSTGRPLCLCEGTNLDDIFDILEQRVPWNIAMANMPALTWHAKLTTARNGSFCICGRQVRQHEHDRKILDIGLEWIDKRVYCLNCLHYQT